MRVTQQMLNQNSIRNMSQNLSRFEKINNQVASGKLLHRPSDDPNGVSKAMNLKSTLATNAQFERNTGEAKLWMDETGQNIDSMVNAMQRVREIAVQGNNGTYSELDQTAMAAEIEELTEHMRQLANAKVNGKSLFNGQKTGELPFPEKGDMTPSSADLVAKTFTIGEGISIQSSVLPEQLFGASADAANLFNTLESMSANLKAGTAIDLEKIDAGIDRLLTVGAENGARQNRLEAVENRLLASNLEIKSMLSRVEDIDYAEAVIKLKSEESIYQASLAATSKIIQPSLMDFLR
ncbi:MULTISPECIES: flagellar hook-associated protein FlgL [Planococcus]|uniref:Flagellar hook-associated protein 3 n=1 Tax=Planococcus faecalis TaxID=1598147 RepID=A0ABM6IN79_9BACL|nr:MULTISPECIES: flagellar hook-associated protein FlgL [Planococcus]AQU77982.1 flagellar hook-associated protein 3 [Planococcus faecalis]MDJ0331399.1 flagellar hook-associated protein FlgL [Planococcus sp. S3-L1]OHX52188.1 flagellar hook-associated protein 3 [Planococcus faecalis]